MKKWTTSTRIGLAGWILGIAFTVFSGRLVYLQVGQHENFSQLAAQKNSIRQVIYARRGSIIDRNGEVLATDIPTRTVIVDGSHVTDPKALAEVASPFLDISVDELTEKFTTDRKYLVIKKDVTEDVAIRLRDAARAKKLPGLYFEQTSRRIYPNGKMLSHVIGFVNHDAVGVQGIEMTMNSYLQGENGFRHIEHDRTGHELAVYRGLENPPKHGYNVRLTIDMAIQAILEEELEKAYNDLQPESISAIFLNPITGEILAMANQPNFDPNDISAAQPEQMKNRAIISMVEPGSTFKIVPVAGVLNENLTTQNSLIFCENGNYHYGGRVLRDHHGYGNLSVHDILVKSSNIGAAKLAMMTGDQKFYGYIRSFGFGERTGIELPGEIPGLVHPPHRWSKISITRIPMGHEIAVTPIQISMAMATIANGGNLMAPQIVREIVTPDGQQLNAFSPQIVRRVVRSEVTREIRSALNEVVSTRGTAPLAHVEGYEVAGKTGTAQRVDPKGGYTPGKYVVSFAGFLPADAPEIVGYVVVDDAKSLNVPNYGGLVAAPIFSRIAERTARYLDIPPTLPALPLASVGTSPPQR
ncbi:MAG: peptidoglycan D,D-transpeptidase FtsI family protein [Chthoniobacterales bacterium]